MEKERLTCTVPEAAELIGVSKPTMYNIVNSADCDFALRVGRKIVISRLALERWLDRKVQDGGVIG